MKQDVDVICRAADCHGNHFVILANACDVGLQLRLNFFLDRVAALFRAEYQMDVVSGIRMGHCVARPGLYPTPSHAPTASAVGYDLSSLTGLAEVSMCLVRERFHLTRN